MAVKIDGKMVSAQIKANLAERVASLKERGINPGLGTILVGSDPGSVQICYWNNTVRERIRF